MQKKRFGEEQIIAILRESEKGEQPIGDVCRAHGIAENTFYRWRQKYGGLQVPEVKRLKDLGQENARPQPGWRPPWQGRNPGRSPER
jgi:putative transposase